MKARKYFLWLFLVFLTLPSQAQLVVQGYTNYALSGFDVLVEDNALTTDSSMTNNAINLLNTKLIEISQLNISQTKKEALQAVPIFMDWNTTTGAAQYHPSEAWLISNGYIAEKARCVEISNVTNFVNWTNQNQPYVVLHELAHAYHHRILNFNNAIITNAYNNAVSQNLYTNVSYHSGGGNYFNVAATYGLNNENEFFAELTEAYFGLNDYFPFDYSDLAGYDTIGFNMVVAIWGDITVSTQSQITKELDNISIYPNPSKDIATLDLGNNDTEDVSIQIFDAQGQMIEMLIHHSNEQLIPLEIKGSSGVYFVKISQNDKHRVVRFLKL